LNRSPVLQRDNEKERHPEGDGCVWHCQKPQLVLQAMGTEMMLLSGKTVKKCSPAALTACFNLFFHHFHNRLTLRHVEVNFVPIEGETQIIPEMEMPP